MHRKVVSTRWTGAQKTDDVNKLMDPQKTREYEVSGAQKTEYKLMNSQKTREYVVTGTQKKTHACKLMDSQKTREYELTGAQKKIDAYRLMYSQKTREYNLNGAQKTDEYLITGAPNPCVQTKTVKNPCVKNSSCVGSAKE